MSAVAIPVRTNRPGVRTVYVWELRKLRAQKRTYLGLGAALIVPLIFVVSLLFDSGGPEGIPFGDYVRKSGLAIPLVGLFFGAFWFFPLITALVAGDIVASEDGNGTLKTILTRSVDRWQIFAGKVLAAFTYAFVALVLYVAVGLVVRRDLLGLQPARLALGQHDLGRAFAAAARRHRARLLPADDRGRLAGDPALDRDPQLRRRGGRDADAVADHAVARRSSPRSTSCARTCCPSSSTRGRACCAIRSTGHRSSGPPGCRHCSPFRRLAGRLPTF